jgi:hypothetical protein
VLPAVLLAVLEIARSTVNTTAQVAGVVEAAFAVYLMVKGICALP